MPAILAAKRAYKFLESLGFNVWVVNLYGSQNYQMSTAESDYDFKALVFPTLDDIIDGSKPVSKIYEFEGGQIDVKDVRLMFDNYKKQNTNFMETLFTPYFVCNGDYFDEWMRIREMANDVAYADPARAMNAMVGMAMEKYHALCHPYESKVKLLEERGYDAKQLSHEYRLFFMLQKFIKNAPYNDLLIPNSDELDFLMKLKTYEPHLSIDEAKKMAKDCVDKMEELKKTAFEICKYSVNEEVYEKLDAIKTKVMKKVFKKAILDE